jgi:transposase
MVDHGGMRAYSEDLPTKIVQAVERGMPKAQAARLFGISVSSVSSATPDLHARGSPWHPEERGGARPPKAHEATRELLEEDLQKRPAATVEPKGGAAFSNFL